MKRHADTQHIYNGLHQESTTLVVMRVLLLMKQTIEMDIIELYGSKTVALRKFIRY